MSTRKKNVILFEPNLIEFHRNSYSCFTLLKFCDTFAKLESENLQCFIHKKVTHILIFIAEKSTNIKLFINSPTFFFALKAREACILTASRVLTPG